MKAKSPLRLAIAALALGASLQANAVNGNGEYREHNVTVALKLFTESDEQFKETNNGFKASQNIVSEKISNTEVLEALVEEGVIDEINGWSIKVLTYGAGEIVGIYLTKKNEDPVDVSDYFEYDVFFALQEYKEKLKENNQGDETYEKTSNILGTGYLDLFIGDFNTDTFSIVKLAARESFKEDGDDIESEAVTKKASFEKIVGEAYEDEEPFGVIEGSIKAGEGKQTDLVEVD